MSTNFDPPIDREDPTSTPPGGSRLRDEVRLHDGHGTDRQVLDGLRADVNRTASQVEGMISDVRRLEQSNRHLRGNTAVAARRMGKLDRTIGAHAAEQLETRLEVAKLEGLVGVPPQRDAMARASSQDLSAEEIEKLDIGTGLYRAISRLTVEQFQEARRTGAAAGKQAGKQAGTRGALVGGGVTAVAVAAIQHADKLEHVFRVLFGG